MQDLRQTKEYANYMELLGWKVVKCLSRAKSRDQIFIKHIPLIGNIAKLQRPSGKLDPRVLDEFAKKHKLAVFYIEPNNHLAIQPFNHFRTSKNCFLPSKTIHINLLRSDKDLLPQMDKDTRYAIRLAQKRGVEIRESADIDAFIKLWTQSARHRGMWLPQTKEIKALWNAFSIKAHLLLSFQCINTLKKLVAGILLVRTPKIAYYMYAASTKEGNKLSAPSLLVWEAIKLAKNPPTGGGCKIFDFEGIYDDRYPQTKNWKGFTKFKEGFGGKIITYPETLVWYSSQFYRFLF